MSILFSGPPPLQLSSRVSSIDDKNLVGQEIDLLNSSWYDLFFAKKVNHAQILIFRPNADHILKQQHLPIILDHIRGCLTHRFLLVTQVPGKAGSSLHVSLLYQESVK